MKEYFLNDPFSFIVFSGLVYSISYATITIIVIYIRHRYYEKNEPLNRHTLYEDTNLMAFVGFLQGIFAGLLVPLFFN